MIENQKAFLYHVAELQLASGPGTEIYAVGAVMGRLLVATVHNEPRGQTLVAVADSGDASIRSLYKAEVRMLYETDANKHPGLAVRMLKPAALSMMRPSGLAQVTLNMLIAENTSYDVLVAPGPPINREVGLFMNQPIVEFRPGA